MPISVRTRQSELAANPWQMLVICQMLNQTSWKQVDQVSPLFFNKWPSASLLVRAERSEIIEIIRPLGFYNRRSSTLLNFSLAWLELEAKWPNPKLAPLLQISKLPGIGKYALDSWKIFQLGDLTVEPTDKVLIKYLEQARISEYNKS